MILNQQQLVDLTGYKRPHKQRQALDIMGVKYFTRLDGKPVVDDSALSVTQSNSTTKPNWSAL